MSTVNATTVLAAITSFPQSATAIAKKMGLNKGSQIMSYLDDLCDNGSIDVDESGRFPVYTKKVTKKNKNLTVTTTADVVNVYNKQNGECKVIPESGKMTNVAVDEDSYIELEGYKVIKPYTNKSGQVGARVVLPITGNNGKKKTVFVKDGMTLVIINDQPKYIVDTPARLIMACHTFAKENNMTASTFTQAKVGQIYGVNDIKMSDVVSIKIEKIDKGA